MGAGPSSRDVAPYLRVFLLVRRCGPRSRASIRLRLKKEPITELESVGYSVFGRKSSFYQGIECDGIGCAESQECACAVMWRTFHCHRSVTHTDRQSSPSTVLTTSPPHILRQTSFRFFVLSRFLSSTAFRGSAVAVGWLVL